MRLPLTSCIIAATLALAACGSKSTPIFLAPTPDVTVSDVGAQTAVRVTVSDERGSAALGKRTSLTGEEENIDSLQDVEDVLRIQIERGLTAKGFVPATLADGASRQLDVKLETFSYDTKSSVVSSKVMVTTEMTVDAIVDGRTFAHSYRSQSEETVALGPTESTRERAVNSALTELLNKFMQDDSLFEALAGQ